MMSFPRKREVPMMVALEREVEEELVDFHNAMKLEPGTCFANSVEHAVPHEEGGAQRDAAALRGLSQAQPVEHAKEIVPPSVRADRASEDGAGRRSKTLPAVLAEVTLSTIGGVPVTDDAGGATVRTGQTFRKAPFKELVVEVRVGGQTTLECIQ